MFKMVESNGKKIVPPCRQCEGTGVTCYRKTRGPVMSLLELCIHQPAILQFTVLTDSTTYTNHPRSPTLYLGNLYHRILLDYPIPTHFELRISDQNCQRYGTSPFSSVKESYFTSSRRSQEQYLLDNHSYGDLVIIYIPIKTNPVAFQELQK